MRMGPGIFLLVLGAILAFAVKDMVKGVDTVMIGYICMGVGVLAIILGLITQNQATNTTNTQVIDRRDTVVEDRASRHDENLN